MVMRCLIVDDSPVFVHAARALLQPEGIAVTAASTSAEALHLLGEVEPDVVLIDVHLGEENGFDVAEQLSRRTNGNVGTPPIYLISSHSPEEFEELIRESPARGFVSKSVLSAAAVRSMTDEGA